MRFSLVHLVVADIELSNLVDLSSGFYRSSQPPPFYTRPGHLHTPRLATAHWRKNGHVAFQ